MQLLGIDVSGVSISAAHGTAEYAAVLQPDSSLAFGIADMAIFETLTVDKLNADWPLLMSADWVFADCNLPQETLRELVARGAGSRFRLAVDAVSVHKVTRLPDDLGGVSALFVNADEAVGYLGQKGAPEKLFEALMARGPGAVVTTLGEEGVLVSEQGTTSSAGFARLGGRRHRCRLPWWPARCAACCAVRT